MPKCDVHSEHCKEMYGYEFREVHRWMDKTAKIKGPMHREDRHDPFETPENAEEIFWNQVPDEYRKFINDAVKDHIILDQENDSKSQKSSRKQKSKLKRRTEVDSKGLRVGNKVEYNDNGREYVIKDRHYLSSTGFFYFNLKSNTYPPLNNVREDHIESKEDLSISEMVRKYEDAYS